MDKSLIVEEVQFIDEALTDDAEASVLRGVKLFDVRRNRNKRRYTQKALDKLKKLYEGAPVNMGHARKGESASVYDRNGVVKNVREQDGQFFGDWHYNPKHPMTERVVWAAVHQPSQYGFSHRAFGPKRYVRGEEVVEDIDRVVSLDLVCDPSTTVSIYESEEALMDLTLAKLKAEYGEIVEALREEFRSENERDAGLQELREEVEQLKGERDALQKKLDEMEAEKAHLARLQEIREAAEGLGLELTEDQVARYAKLDKEIAESTLNDLAEARGSKPDQSQANRQRQEPRQTSGQHEKTRSEKFSKLARYVRS